jgi:hypothetical protein
MRFHNLPVPRWTIAFANASVKECYLPEWRCTLILLQSVSHDIFFIHDPDFCRLSPMVHGGEHSSKPARPVAGLRGWPKTGRKTK